MDIRYIKNMSKKKYNGQMQRREFTLDEFKAIMDVTYENKDYLLVKCYYGHITRVSKDDLATFCPECAIAKQGLCKELCRDMFMKLFDGQRFMPCRPKWLTNPDTSYRLELDGYNERLNIAFEYRGYNHYRGKNAETQPKRDEFKQKMCNEKGIVFVIIPYTEENVCAYVISQLREHGIYVDEKKYQEILAD